MAARASSLVRDPQELNGFLFYDSFASGTLSSSHEP